MLNPDKLRYLGLDLHSRTRRRVVVAVSWVVFLLGMSILNDVLDKVPWFVAHPIGSMCLAFLGVSVFMLGSVFREGGAVRRSALPIWKIRGRKGERFVLLRDLDDWARYKFGGKLDDLPEEQQHEVLRTYRVGYYLFPADQSKTPERLDEREMAVRDRASAATLKWLTLFCFSLAGVYGSKIKPLAGKDVAEIIFTLGCFAFNGPASIILWNEPDPRETGELTLVEQPSS